MSPRRYSIDKRQAAAEETRRRIVEATVELHAQQGVLPTTYAMIAERANVAIPTVYNHFPARSDVLEACTSHVAALAPPFGPEIFTGVGKVDQRLRALARAVLARHRHYAPWMRWAIHEAPLIPELAAVLQNARPTARDMIACALEPEFGSEPSVALVALCEALLDFRTAQQLWYAPGLKPEDAEQTLADALIALVKLHRREGGPAMTFSKKTKTRSNEP